MRPRTFHFTRSFSPDYGIDLGTAHTHICSPGEGIVLDEPSIVAAEQGSRRVLNDGQAAGNRAKIMEGRTPESIRILRPLQHGVIADHELCVSMLRSFLWRARPRRWGLKPRVLIAIPRGITPVERQALLTTAIRAGARQVFLINKSLAAALGVGLPLHEPTASMICDIGSGITEIAVLCLGDVASSESLRIAGDEMDRSIVDLLRRKHRLRIGEQMAERIKIEIGSALPLESELSFEVGGRDVVTGLPRKLTLSSDEVREALQEPVRAIVDQVESVLERCREELAADLVENGMVLAGGVAALRGLDRKLAQATGMPVRVAEEPSTCVARGLAICLEHLDMWNILIESRKAA